MRITTISICGEADHPLIDEFKKHYAKISDTVIIQMGVTYNWNMVNGDTSGSGLIFPEKTEQHNAALSKVPRDTDYVFYFDVDEFLPLDNGLEGFLEVVQPDVVEFQWHQMWKKDNYQARGGDGWGFEAWNPRIFKYYPGMRFEKHRPPTLNKPDPKIVKCLLKGVHYSYVYRTQTIRKLLYYNKIYPQFDYMKWFREVWEAWTPDTREQIEKHHSIHPSVKNAWTEKFTGKHEIEWLP